jgi:hypothetical protein
LAYRHFHEQSNLATVFTVLLAEAGCKEFDPEVRGQELALHGLLQQGPFIEGRGVTLANGLRYLRNADFRGEILHDPQRTGALGERLRGERPGFELELLKDLDSPPPQPLLVERDFAAHQSLILVEARAGLGRLPLHLLLVRPWEDRWQIMNSDTGRNHDCSLEQLTRHLSCPVKFGATAFAGGLYVYTGLAIKVGR